MVLIALVSLAHRTDAQCDDVTDCWQSDFGVIVDDPTVLYYEAVMFRNCCPITTIDGCQGSGGDCMGLCSLAYENSHLATKGDPTINLWENLFNSVAYEIHDYVDIYEYLITNGLSEMSICGETFRKHEVHANIVRWSRQVLEIGLVPQWDEIRKRMMFGYGAPLNENFPDDMERVNYCWHFHAASAVEPIARFLKLLGPPSLIPQAPRTIGNPFTSIQDELYSKVTKILEPYYGDWNGTMYLCPAENEALDVTDYEVPYNQAASIGMTYMDLYDYGGDPFFLDRAVSMATRIKSAVCADMTPYLDRCYCVWFYSSRNDRVEDPDHGMEVLRFAIRMERAGMVFDTSTLFRMLSTWFDLGLEGTDCLTSRIDGECPTCTIARLEDVAPRALFLLRYSPPLFDKAIGMAPFLPCVPSSDSGCCSASLPCN